MLFDKHVKNEVIILVKINTPLNQADKSGCCAAGPPVTKISNDNY
jgi:hypothetical protein